MLILHKNANKSSLMWLIQLQNLRIYSWRDRGGGGKWRQERYQPTCFIWWRSLPRFPDCKANARRSVLSPQDHFIIILIISDRRNTRGKWPLARNPDRSWWHCHTSLRLFWPQPMTPWTGLPHPSQRSNPFLPLPSLTSCVILLTSLGTSMSSPQVSSHHHPYH